LIASQADKFGEDLNKNVEGIITMETDEELERLDSELERHKEELRHDVTQIKSGIQAGRDAVSPTKLLGRKPLLIMGLAMVAGFVYGYRGYSVVEAMQPTVEAVKPAAKAAFGTAVTAGLNAAAAQAGARAVRAYKG
jgi:hypothetical protein